MHRLLILLLCCAAAGGSTGAARSVALDGYHDPSLRQSSPRQLQPAPDISTGADGSCHLHSSTRPVQNVVAGNGQVFSVQSQEDDDEGFAVSDGWCAFAIICLPLDDSSHTLYTHGMFRSPAWDFTLTLRRYRAAT